MYRLLSFVFFSSIVLNTSHAFGQTVPDESKLIIKWNFPGEFQAAKNQAIKQKRILLMKGLGFGLDQLGAKCSTKGCW